MRQKTQAELNRPSAEEVPDVPRMPVVFVLENVRSGNNVGSVLRTADAFGVAQIVMTGITPTPPHREILKASLGAEESVPWRFEEGIEPCLRAFRQNGSRIYALEQTTASISIEGFGFGESPQENSPADDLTPLVIVLGNEVRGVSAEALTLVDGAIEIPQHGMKHSLNVSVAAGIVAYALRRGWERARNTKTIV